MKRLRESLLNWPLALALLTTLLFTTLAYQFDAAHGVDVGGYYDRVYVSGFHDREAGLDGESFRWSTSEATVLLPGVGARGRWLTLRLHGWRPAGLPTPDVLVSANGHYLGAAATSADWQEYLFWVPPEALAGGTARIVLQVDPFVPGPGDPRSLGLAVSRVALLPIGGGGFSPGWPAWDQLALALLLAALLYLGLAAAGLAPRWAALGAAGPALALCWGLAWHRLWTTIFTSRLALAAGLGLLLVLLLRWLYPRLLAWARVAIAAQELRFLLVIFLVGFMVKSSGLLYPYSVAVDLKLQLQWSSWIWDGRLTEFYGIDSPLHKKTMPAEWGSDEEKPLIPYSPYWHITAASFFLLPWRPYDTANVVNVLLDTSKPLLLYLIARRLGLNRRTGLGAALLQALFPANLLVLAWGNAPTMLGVWWTLAATTYMVGAWERLNRPRTWAGLAFFLLAAMLYYTVYAALMGVFMILFLVGMACQRGKPGGTLPAACPESSTASRPDALVGGESRRDERGQGFPHHPQHTPRVRISPLVAAALALVAAVGLALLLYYGQFVRPVVTETLPKLLASAQQEGSGIGKEANTWAEYLQDHHVRMGSNAYGLLWPMLLALGSLATGWKHAVQRLERRPLRRGVLYAWIGTVVVFFLLGYQMDMVVKEFWFLLPALALCAAVTLEWLWQRGPAGRVVAAATYLYLAAAGITFWITRLASYLQDWVGTDAPVVGEVMRALESVLYRAAGG